MMESSVWSRNTWNYDEYNNDNTCNNDSNDNDNDNGNDNDNNSSNNNINNNNNIYRGCHQSITKLIRVVL